MQAQPATGLQIRWTGERSTYFIENSAIWKYEIGPHGAACNGHMKKSMAGSRLTLEQGGFNIHL
jgi:hypothetical protein